MQKLTAGALMRFAKNSACGEQPILQVLNVKVMDSKAINDTSTTATQHTKAQRYRLILSDGKHFLPSCVLTVQLNDLVISGELQEYAIIRLDRYLRSDLKGQAAKMILQILQVTVLDIASHKIGNPVSLLTADFNEDTSAMASTSREILQPKIPAPLLKRPTAPITAEPLPILPPPPPPTMLKHEAESIKDHRLFKIEALNPFQNRWTIRVRVAYKKPVRLFSNGEGRLFTCDLIDETGEIRATGFGADCDRFEPVLSVGSIYYITQAHIKYANKQYNTLANDFEMTFHDETIIELCSENVTSIPVQRLHFVPIEQIPNLEKNSFTDVIGIVMSIRDLVHGRNKQNKEYTKRDVVIVDRTGQITVTLWYQMAETFPTSAIRTVIMFKGVCVNDFNGGRTLSALGSAQIQIDPDVPVAHDLRTWYLEEGMNVEMTDVSTHHSSIAQPVPWKTLAQITDHEVHMTLPSNGDVSRVKAVCTHVRHDPVYKACTRSSCKKKLQDNNDGTYYCSKCEMNYEDFQLLYMASILLSDSTGNQWVSFFEKESEMLFGCPPTQFPCGKSKDDEERAYQKLLSVCGRESMFLIRAKVTRYNNQDRLQFTCVGMETIDARQISRLYIEDIGRMCCLLLN